MKPKDMWIVDGYNIIFSDKKYWRFHEDDISHSRKLLCDELLDFSAHRDVEVVVVFDGNKTEAAGTEEQITRDFKVVFTATRETADSYIERLAYSLKDEYRHVYVATSDGPEQSQVLGSGAYRVPARELMETLHEDKKAQAIERAALNTTAKRIAVAEHLGAEATDILEQIRRRK